MGASGSEARFGILIEGRNQSGGAYDEVIRQNNTLIATVERLISVSQEQARQTHFINDAIRGAAEEAKRLAEEQARVAAEAEKMAAAQKKAAAETRAMAEAQKAARENMIEWAAAAATTGALLLTASGYAGDFQEKIDLTADATGLLAREQGALIIAATNVGRTFDQISPSIDIFVRKLAEARRGVPEAVSAFSDAGVSDLSQPTGVILQQVGGTLTGIADPAERSRVAFELFGRSFRTISQVITQDLKSLAADSERTGVVFSGAMEQAARTADTSGDRIKQAIDGIKKQVSVGLATTGGNALKEFFAGAFSGFAEFITWVNKSNDELGKFQVGIERGRPAARFVPGRLLRERLDDPAQPNFYGTAYDAPPRNIFAGIQGGPASGLTPLGDLGFAAASNTSQMSPVVDEAKKMFDDLTASGKALLEVEKARGSILTKELDKADSTQPGFKIGRQDRNLLRLEREFGTGNTPADLKPAALAEFEKQRDKAEDRAKKAMDDKARELEQLVNGLKSSFSTFISSALTGVRSLSDAFDALVQSVLGQAVETGVSALFSAIGLQGGGTPMLAGIPHAQTGMTLSGMRGVDSTLAAIGYGESVVDHTTTDGLRLLVPQMADFFSRGGGKQGGATVVNLHFGEGAFNIQSGLDDPAFVQEVVNDRIMPAIGKALRYGTSRRSG